ncbi:hypothetical protein [Brevundimonas sp.]|uniref:hypothetical protein n=1 Tax=Brevundimonas sp. TaxID=1871086 RepID=UPI002D3EE1CE|nr:hypothetical protein [Brevundimonas sp.]HYD26995.1 hypothetical protein [Brevundimonas sp.]
MDNIAGIAGLVHARHPSRTPVRTAAVLMAADRVRILLTRNEAIREPLGGRTWRGVLTNAADALYLDVAVRLRFHDREGRPVGAPVSARAGRLDPGAGLDLQARLPAGAVGLQVRALRWTVAGRTVETGPGDRSAFGQVQD